ncbi:septum formation initiator family protein [Halobacteriovorax sp. ZH4_bin.1]|uniref:FtsB family cell division protein n=1 Tax=unclassified Halobacteriovorax TaxID=2639665 RepID=UPI003721A1B0
MQFSLGRNRGPSASGSASKTNSSSEQNSRSAAMQKAIERNRAKMASRGTSRPMGTPPPTPGASATARPRPRPMSAPSREEGESSESGSSVLAKLRAQRAQREASAAPKPAAAPRPTPTPSAASASGTPTRKPITQADNIEMSSPLRKKATAPATVNYADQTPAKAIAKAKTAVSAKRKVKSKSKKKGELTHWGVKLCWGFCLFLLGRLVFSQGGVIEYFDKKSTLDQAYHEVTLLKAENDGLMKELDLIRNNHRYKKKLVRDHLGYIARDEYLILFPETSETSGQGLSSI